MINKTDYGFVIEQIYRYTIVKQLSLVFNAKHTHAVNPVEKGSLLLDACIRGSI